MKEASEEERGRRRRGEREEARGEDGKERGEEERRRRRRRRRRGGAGRRRRRPRLASLPARHPHRPRSPHGAARRAFRPRLRLSFRRGIRAARRTRFETRRVAYARFQRRRRRRGWHAPRRVRAGGARDLSEPTSEAQTIEEAAPSRTPPPTTRTRVRAPRVRASRARASATLRSASPPAVLARSASLPSSTRASSNVRRHDGRSRERAAAPRSRAGGARGGGGARGRNAPSRLARTERARRGRDARRVRTSHTLAAAANDRGGSGGARRRFAPTSSPRRRAPRARALLKRRGFEPWRRLVASLAGARAEAESRRVVAPARVAFKSWATRARDASRPPRRTSPRESRAWDEDVVSRGGFRRGERRRRRARSTDARGSRRRGADGVSFANEPARRLIQARRDARREFLSIRARRVDGGGETRNRRAFARSARGWLEETQAIRRALTVIAATWRRERCAGGEATRRTQGRALRPTTRGWKNFARIRRCRRARRRTGAAPRGGRRVARSSRRARDVRLSPSPSAPSPSGAAPGRDARPPVRRDAPTSPRPRAHPPPAPTLRDSLVSAWLAADDVATPPGAKAGRLARPRRYPAERREDARARRAARGRASRRTRRQREGESDESDEDDDEDANGGWRRHSRWIGVARDARGEHFQRRRGGGFAGTRVGDEIGASAGSSRHGGNLRGDAREARTTLGETARTRGVVKNTRRRGVNGRRRRRREETYQR